MRLVLVVLAGLIFSASAVADCIQSPDRLRPVLIRSTGLVNWKTWQNLPCYVSALLILKNF